MTDAQRKQNIQKTFNTVAEGYGGAPQRFFTLAAAQLPEIFALRGDEHVLDVACGTGIAACALAPHLPRGQVTGLDFSSGMLTQALKNAQTLGHENIDFVEMDMQAITLPARRYDAANCSFGLFFVSDMLEQLKHIASKVKPGGTVVCNAFFDSAFSPNVDLFLERIKSYGIEPPEFSWKRVGSEDKFAALYRAAGLRDVKTVRADVGYTLTDAEGWWDVVWFAGFRGLVNQLAAEHLEQFKRAHLAEIQALDVGDGIPMNVQIVYAKGVVV
jgi:ubiquinone/menaquinone biosynthesis C-methylase UbiE